MWREGVAVVWKLGLTFRCVGVQSVAKGREGGLYRAVRFFERMFEGSLIPGVGGAALAEQGPSPPSLLVPTPPLPPPLSCQDNTGYDLKQLFIGAEGTLGECRPPLPDLRDPSCPLSDLDQSYPVLCPIF